MVQNLGNKYLLVLSHKYEGRENRTKRAFFSREKRIREKKIYVFSVVKCLHNVLSPLIHLTIFSPTTFFSNCFATCLNLLLSYTFFFSFPFSVFRSSLYIFIAHPPEGTQQPSRNTKPPTPSQFLQQLQVQKSFLPSLFFAFFFFSPELEISSPAQKQFHKFSNLQNTHRQ